MYLTTPFTSLIIAATVLLSGAHAKDVAMATLPAQWLEVKKQATDAQPIVKVAGEPHHHVDTVKVQPGDGHQTDTRSLRLLHHKKYVAARPLGERFKLWLALNLTL